MKSLSISPLYLSRLLLNPRSRQVISELNNAYEMHRTLMRAFPQATDVEKKKARDEFGVLFRAEVDDPSGAVKIIVQSRVEPNWSFLDGLIDYLWDHSALPAYDHKDIMPACRDIQSGLILRFRLRANPTKRLGKQGDPMKGKRIELFREDEQIDWLIRKGKIKDNGVGGGFDLLRKKVGNVKDEERPIWSVKVSREGKQKGRKRSEGRLHRTTHLAVRFDGILRVTDADAFCETLVRGIGPAKAFGFGLLSVAPA